MSLQSMVKPELKPGCLVGQLMSDLDPDEASALKTMFDTPDRHSAAYIHTALKGEGHSIGLHSIKNHRSGTCNCK